VETGEDPLGDLVSRDVRHVAAAQRHLGLDAQAFELGVLPAAGDGHQAFMSGKEVAAGA
jgi:hypothetical protein